MKVAIRIIVPVDKLLWWVLISIFTGRIDLLAEAIQRLANLSIMKKKLKIPFEVKVEWIKKKSNT
jgi:hypothetical protein